jgi:AraC-like DNA-binding protein
MATARDPLSDVVRALELTGGVFLEARLTAPWSITAQVSPEDCGPFMEVPSQIIAYHVVTQGSMMVELDGGDFLDAAAGQIVLLPRNDVHTIMSEAGLRPELGEDLVLPQIGDGLLRIDHGGGGMETLILCGFLASSGASPPILGSLPRVLTVSLDDIESIEWIQSSVRIAARELSRGRIASSAVMSRLSELLFVEALRRYCESDANPVGWLGGMRDLQIGRALALLHGDLAKVWTVEALAAEVGMSRSAFVDRFAQLVGSPPIRYLTHIRLIAARLLLHETELTSSEIAYRVGYEAPVAFNRAFKRAFGLPPAAWRDQDRNAAKAAVA